MGRECRRCRHCFTFVFNVPPRFENNSPHEIAFNTIKVPAGQRVEVTLADGTHLWLNARSEFSYPVSFNGDKREVHLKGEAFSTWPETKIKSLL